MKSIITRGLLVLGLAMSHATAQEGDLPDHKLSEWKLGEHLFGDEVAMDTLKGRVVVIEEWGVRWGPCITAMPHLVKMDKKMKPKGLSIIAAESQNTPADTIKGLLDDHKANFTVTRQVRGPIQSRGIPNAFVFDVEGQLIFKGHPMSDEFEKVIKTALKDYEAEPAEEERKGDLFPQRTWKNSEGKPLVAAITEINGDTITFKLRNGKKIPYEISKLSEEDQALIKEKAGEE